MDKNKKREIIYLSINEIIPYENNPRHNEEAVETVSKSLDKFGFQQPIVLDENKVIIVGHTRYKAALALGYEEVPVVIADDLTPEEAKAYRLADNKTGELAKWDFPKLDFELGALTDLDFNMQDFGFMYFDQDESENDFSDFFIDADPKQMKEEDIKTSTIDSNNEKSENKKSIQCPHCGEWFEIEL